MKLSNLIFIAQLIGIVVVIWLMDLGELTRSLKSIKFDYIVLAFSLELAAFLVWAQKWKFIVDKFEKVKFTTIFLCLMAGNYLRTNEIRARSLGGFGRAGYLQKFTHNRTLPDCYATIVMDQTSNSFVFFPLAMLSMLFVFLFLNIPWWLSLIMGVIALIVFLMILAAFFSRRKINETAFVRFLRPKLQRIYNVSAFKILRDRFDSYGKFEELIISNLAEFVKTYKQILKDRSTFARDVGLSVLMFALMYSKDYVLVQGAGYDISVLHLIVGLSITFWLTAVIPVPTGPGFKELVMITIFTMVGVPFTTAVIVTLIHWAIYLSFVVGIAYLAVILLRIINTGDNQHQKAYIVL